MLGSPPQASVPELPPEQRGCTPGGGAGLGRSDTLLLEHLGPVPRPTLCQSGWLVRAEEARGEEGGLEGQALLVPEGQPGGSCGPQRDGLQTDWGSVRKNGDN